MYAWVCWEAFAVLLFVIFWRIWRQRLRVADIHRRHVFITGCDTGFGRLLAEKLDRQGVNVYAGCLNKSTISELKEKCSSRIKPVQVDVTDTSSVRAAAKCVEEDLNGKALWAIVNNAGVAGQVCPFEWSSKAAVQKVLDVNLLGVYDVTLAFLYLLRRGGEGRVVNIASIFGRVSFMTGGYPLSKFGVQAFSDGLSCELRPFNITVHTLEPGFFQTNLADSGNATKSLRNVWASLDPKLKEEYGGEEYLEKVSNYTNSFLARVISPRVDKVVAAYEHALLSRYPKNRYVVGFDAKFFFIPMSWLPSALQLHVVRILEQLGPDKRPYPKNAAR